MSNNARPTFGVNNTVNIQEKRTELGAIWRRSSKRDNSEFLSIKINIPKDRLKHLLDKEGEVVNLGLVAFINDFKNDDFKKPDFRIFEEQE